MLTRREFLGTSILGSLALAMFPNFEIERLHSSPVEFDYNAEYGNVFRWEGKIEKSAREWLISMLKEDASKCLPPGCPFEIREAIPGDYGRSRAMAWYYSPEFTYAFGPNKIVGRRKEGNRDVFITHRNITGRNTAPWIEERIDVMAPDGSQYWLVERCISR